MTSKRDLLTALRRAEEERDTQFERARQYSNEAIHLEGAVASLEVQLAQTRAQLAKVTEARSLEIRTEALRQVLPGTPIEQRMRDAYRVEQYLAKGVTLPTETPNLTTALSWAKQAVASLTENLEDDSYANSLNAILEALQWAGRMAQENIELAAENERLTDLYNLEQDSAEMQADAPVTTQAEPSTDWVRNAVIDLLAPKASTRSLQDFVERALDWVLEDDSQQRFHDLALSSGVLQRAQIVNALRRGDETPVSGEVGDDEEDDDFFD